MLSFRSKIVEISDKDITEKHALFFSRKGMALQQIVAVNGKGG